MNKAINMTKKSKPSPPSIARELRDGRKHRKLIDIPFNILPELEKLAKKDNRDLKNYIETQLIAIVARTKKA